MGIGKRIKEARENLGLTQAELGDIIGVTGSSITNYEKETSHPKEPIMYKLVEALQVDTNYLFQDVIKIPKKLQNISKSEIKNIDILNKYNNLDEHGKEAVNSIIEVEIKRMNEEKTETNRKNSKEKTITQDVLTFDLPASAGTGMFLDSESCEHIEYPADIVPTGTDFAIRVSGDSMEPKYLDGSTAFVRKVEVSDGDVGIFVLNGDGYIKKLEYKDNSTYLVSLNPKYDDIKILETDNLYCVGKVLN